MALGNNLARQEKKEDKEEIAEKPVSKKDDEFEEVDESDIEEVEKKNLKQFCVFKAGSEEYALPMDLVKEVVKSTKQAPLPQMPDYILGMTNIRGNIYGIMDLEVFFRVGSNAKHNFLLVLNLDDFNMAIGIAEVPDSLIVDMEEIEELKSSTLKSVMGQKHLKGVIKKDTRMIIIFDIEGIVSNENFTIPAND